MNFTDKLRDVMTLAHELGHGLHQYLSRGVGYLQCDTPLTTAEMASVFGEMLTFQRLQEIYPEPRTRLAHAVQQDRGRLRHRVPPGGADALRADRCTRPASEQGELTHGADQRTVAGRQPADARRRGPADATATRWWWSYIGHFIHVPFYCYAYAFGELLVLALVQKYKQEGRGVRAEVPGAAGRRAARDAPHVLLAKLGVDVTDPAFWELGLRLLGDMVTRGGGAGGEAIVQAFEPDRAMLITEARASVANGLWVNFSDGLSLADLHEERRSG